MASVDMVHRRASPAGVVAVGVLVLSTALRLVSVWVSIRSADAHLAIGYGVWLETASAGAVFGTVASIVGAIVAARQPRNAFGWILVVGGASQAIVAGSTYVPAVLLAGTRSDAPLFLAWLAGPILHSSIIGLPALGLLIFPDGRLLTRRWWPVAILVVVAMAARFLDVAFMRATLVALPGLTNPYQLTDSPAAVVGVIGRLGLPAGLVALLLAAWSMLRRYAGASPVLRRQLLWFTWAGHVVAAASVPLVVGILTPAASAGPDAGWATVFFLVLTLLPVAAGLAILRYRLYDIDRIVNRTIVYGALTAILAGTFTAAIALAQRLFVTVTGETSDAAIVLTTLVVATIYHPIRSRLEGLVARRFKYDRPSFGPMREEIEQVLAIIEPTRVAQRLADAAVAGLGAVGAASIAADGSLAASAGRWPVDPVVQLTIGAVSGRPMTIVIGPRSDGGPHDPARLSGFEELAALAAEAVRIGSPTRR